jgi:hypothetical protein
MYIKGGLGNQLFQYAYLHNYIFLDKNSSVELIPEQITRIDRPFELGTLAESCSHLSVAKLDSSNSTIPISRLLRSKVRLLSFFANSLTSNHEGTELHEKRMFQFSQPQLSQMNLGLPLRGYFQHWKYVEEAWNLIEPELKESFSSLKSQSKIPHLQERETVIHIRGGDFKEHINSFGALGADYYLRALNEIRKRSIKIGPVLVLTDDVEFAETLIPELNLSEYLVFGPDECSAWEALLLMSEAKYLVTANSTLSWWGAFLAYKSGSICVTPNPWHRNVPGNSQIALGYPGFLSVDSGLSSDDFGETSKEEEI